MVKLLKDVNMAELTREVSIELTLFSYGEPGAYFSFEQPPKTKVSVAEKDGFVWRVIVRRKKRTFCVIDILLGCLRDRGNKRMVLFDEDEMGIFTEGKRVMEVWLWQREREWLL